MSKKRKLCVPADFTFCFICADDQYDSSSFKKRLVEGIDHPIWTCDQCYEIMLEYFVELAVPPPRIFFVKPKSDESIFGRKYFTNIKDFETWNTTTCEKKNKYVYGITTSDKPIDQKTLDSFVNGGNISSSYSNIFWADEYEYSDDLDEGEDEGEDAGGLGADFIINVYKSADVSCPFISQDDESLVYRLDLPKFYKAVEKNLLDSIDRHRKAYDQVLTQRKKYKH